MYKFEIFTPDTINVEEYENFDHKNLFTTLKWFEFLKEFRHVKPIMIRICDNSGMFTGYFSGAIQSFTGIRILGSPFYGWMGQHMGFDLCDEETVIKHVLIDEIIEFISRNCRISMLMLSDFKFDAEVYEKCSVKLFRDTDHATYFLDLTQTENMLFKNFKSGYRTCVRKFEKLGGTIIEEQDESFITEHHKQLTEVFARKQLSSPNYSKRLHILFSHFPEMVLAINALDAEGHSIASSYYLGNGTLAFFASNASLTDHLYYNANQALMWYAIKYWKSKGIKCLDLGGRAEYKANFGAELRSTPAVIWTKHEFMYRLFTGARKAYYNKFAFIYKLKNIFKKDEKDKKETVEDTTPETTNTEVNK